MAVFRIDGRYLKACPNVAPACCRLMPYADLRDARLCDLADVARDFIGGIPPLPDHTFFARREFDRLRRAIKVLRWAASTRAPLRLRFEVGS